MRTAYIVAGGPSLRGFDWSRLDGKFVVGINRAFEVLPNAQIIYFGDAQFFANFKDGLLEHTGHLVRGCARRENLHPRIVPYLFTGTHGLDLRRGCLRSGINSAYAAINLLAAHLGVRRIFLLGVDMGFGVDGNSHWHTGYDVKPVQGGYNRMALQYKTIVGPLARVGCEVLNASPTSRLDVFPKIAIDEALPPI